MNTEPAALRLLFPSIKWDEPVLITLLEGGSGYACRYCIVQRGLKGQEVMGLPKDPEDVRRHIKDWHP